MEGEAMDIDVDFMKADSWDGAMHARLAWLRSNDPVHWSEASGLWLVSRFADVSHVSKNPEVFCSGQGVRPGIPVRQSLIDEDAPRHTQLRSLINKGFTPRMVANLEPRFLQIVSESIDAVADRGECDFVTDIAVPLPLLLIADMIGIRREDRARFHAWSDAMMAGDGNYDKPDIMQAAAEAFVGYSTYITQIIEDRRKQPRDDLVSILVGAKDSGILEEFEPGSAPGTAPDEVLRSDLQNDELIMLLVLLLAAGNETTRNAISGGMQLLIEHPEARQRLIDDPTLIPGAVDEMLRHVTPVQSFARTATRDTELGGKTIQQGQKVLMLYSSANRDEDVFDDPDDFDVERKPSHLAFGIGSHFCLGANLARMEMRVAFEQLLRRLPDMRYSTHGPTLRPNALVRSCVSMPVRFTPEAS
jgi:cytochrome P450 family 142 subfamily A polypeptide 1